MLLTGVVVGDGVNFSFPNDLCGKQHPQVSMKTYAKFVRGPVFFFFFGDGGGGAPTQ